ncbi:hypothetical protein CJF42_25305 [Pseudoalteromonas sp. NBT06-2]|uniref:hypothetical protein n=1 Tax=Pseudoalteromonas sp. NBT06-2 TaxID=2025950 RepID=UPI000BA5A612|nr:hypothetical protein [Pseudoalteromonas sp. NBT06-2]PAJ71701.1 hypothetical protein CJF42_25305 [Pseudoalteromonas sp. NBT06-2]
MSKITKLDVCKFIATIEGYAPTISKDCDGSECIAIHDENQQKSETKIYDPFEDDALCFQLMAKYKVKIDYDENENPLANIETQDNWRWMQAVSHNGAILLAIIKAYNPLSIQGINGV